MIIEQAFKENRDIYLFTSDEGRIMFKLLDYGSFKSIKYVMLTYPEFKTDLEDKIWDNCVIEHTAPVGRDMMSAGIVSTIAQTILFLSCPKSVEEINQQLFEARGLVEDAREQAILAICEAFPSYLPEDLEKLSWPMIVRRLAQSEVILKRELGFESLKTKEEDSSNKIFDMLEEYTNTAVDFSKVNRDLHQEEYGNPSGDFNLNNIRGH